MSQLLELENKSGRCFGGGTTPLLVSVRSGAPVSMPGMMDTILNLGLNMQSAQALARATGDSNFVFSTLIRFHSMFSEIVLDADGENISEAAEEFLRFCDPNAEAFSSLIRAMRSAEEEETGSCVPENPVDQLHMAIRAVFDSWNTNRAVTYRRHHGITDTLGTAVVVQAMVFGNLGSPSGSGVVFTRNPTTGVHELYGEFMEGTQGEDVVSGTKTPDTISQAAQKHPQVFETVARLAADLEERYSDVLDLEFTVEEGKLYFLQVRSAKRTAMAAVRIAADFLDEGHSSPVDALRGITADQIREVERPRFSAGDIDRARSDGKLLGKGISASPGQVSGMAVLDPDRACALVAEGKDVILLRPTTSPLDLHGMIVSKGIITALGGATSHAAVVARALGLPSVVGCKELAIEADSGRFSIDSIEFSEGETLSIDGSSGEIFLGEIPLTSSEVVSSALDNVLQVAREAARCRLYGIGTTVDKFREYRRKEADGIVVRMVDLLVSNSLIEDFETELLKQSKRSNLDLRCFEEVIAELLAPLIYESEHFPVIVRAMDFLGGDASDVLDLSNLTRCYPGLNLPLGVAELLRVQMAALGRASGKYRDHPVPKLVFRNISDVCEMHALIRMAKSEMLLPERGDIDVGALITTPIGAMNSINLAKISHSLWFDVQRLLEGYFGYPLGVFTSGEPLDEYVKLERLPYDPRKGASEAQRQIIMYVNKASSVGSHCEIGVKLPAPASEELVATYYRAGVRLFTAEAEEIRATMFSLGKEALLQEEEMQAGNEAN